MGQMRGSCCVSCWALSAAKVSACCWSNASVLVWSHRTTSCRHVVFAVVPLDWALSLSLSNGANGRFHCAINNNQLEQDAQVQVQASGDDHRHMIINTHSQPDQMPMLGINKTEPAKGGAYKRRPRNSVARLLRVATLSTGPKWASGRAERETSSAAHLYLSCWAPLSLSLSQATWPPQHEPALVVGAAVASGKFFFIVRLGPII